MKYLPGKFPVIFIGTSIGMPMYSGNNFFENSSYSKFGCTENAQEMLDQYYQNDQDQ